MRFAAYTWGDASRGLETLLALCNDWLPEAQSGDANRAAVDTLFSRPESTTGTPMDPNEWLMNQEQLDMFWNPVSDSTLPTGNLVF